MGTPGVGRSASFRAALGFEGTRSTRSLPGLEAHTDLDPRYAEHPFVRGEDALGVARSGLHV